MVAILFYLLSEVERLGAEVILLVRSYVGSKYSVCGYGSGVEAMGLSQFYHSWPDIGIQV